MPITDPYGEKPSKTLSKRPLMDESHIHESFPPMSKITPSHQGSQSSSPGKEDDSVPSTNAEETFSSGKTRNYE